MSGPIPDLLPEGKHRGFEGFAAALRLTGEGGWLG